MILWCNDIQYIVVHRIIASSPGRTKSMTSSITNRMVNSDAPLYIECHCTKGSSSAHPVISQLMRIHIVTPKAPMHITLNPRVIPCPDGPTFHPGWHSQKLSDANTTDGRSSETSNHIRLPISTYWVLRLPFIYWGEGGSHLPPKEVPDASYGRLLKGFIGITEDYSYR
jgi:protein SMG8